MNASHKQQICTQFKDSIFCIFLDAVKLQIEFLGEGTTPSL